MLFAQIVAQRQGGFGNPGGPAGGGPGAGGPPPEFWIIFGIVMAVLLAVGLAIQIFFLLTLSKALHECDERSRTMEPVHVWFNLIPCFNLIWIFFTVTRVPESIGNEFRARRMRGDGDFGKSVGLTYAIMVLLSNIPYIGGIFGIVALVCFIMFWVKIAGFGRQLREDMADREYDRGPADDDRGYRDEDDRPSRRRDDD